MYYFISFNTGKMNQWMVLAEYSWLNEFLKRLPEVQSMKYSSQALDSTITNKIKLCCELNIQENIT